MKSSTLPVICSVALTATLAAGVSHWWSVRQFAIAFHDGLPPSTISLTGPAVVEPAPQILATSIAKPEPGQSTPTPAQDPKQQDFYDALIAKIKSVENQNRDLLDQMAETNRDLMQIQFRVDTHSESFRPLPVSEERPFTSVDDEAGVLPPRAEPVELPSFE